MKRRRLLQAALAGTTLLSLGCSTSSTVPPPSSGAPTLELLPWGPHITPALFLTARSRERDVAGLEALIRTHVLPLLDPADVAHAVGPVEGAIQFWLMLDTADLKRYGLDVDDALALLAETLGGAAGPVPGRHGLHAWAIDVPDQTTFDPHKVTLPLSGHPYAPLFALGTTEFTTTPPAWRDQSRFSCYLQPRSRLDATFLQRCEGLLQSAGDALPADLEIQIGKIDDPLLTLPTLFVEVTDDPWGVR